LSRPGFTGDKKLREDVCIGKEKAEHSVPDSRKEYGPCWQPLSRLPHGLAPILLILYLLRFSINMLYFKAREPVLKKLFLHL